MSISEFQRHQIFQWCEEVMGPERAAVMMDLLPPVGWGDIATRTDLHALRSDLRGEMAELRGEMVELRGELRGEMAELRSEVRTEIAELRGEMAELRGDVRAEMHSMRADVVRTLSFAMVASNATLVGLVLAAVRLG